MLRTYSYRTFLNVAGCPIWCPKPSLNTGRVRHNTLGMQDIHGESCPYYADADAGAPPKQLFVFQERLPILSCVVGGVLSRHHAQHSTRKFECTILYTEKAHDHYTIIHIACLLRRRIKGAARAFYSHNVRLDVQRLWDIRCFMIFHIVQEVIRL